MATESKSYLFYYKTQGRNWSLPRPLIFENYPFEVQYIVAAVSGHRFSIQITRRVPGAGKQQLWSITCSEGDDLLLKDIMQTVLQKMAIYSQWCPTFRLKWVGGHYQQQI